MSECLVLPGIGGLAVQGLLLACCIGIFYLKGKREQTKLGLDARSKEEFILDGSKQFASAGWIHIMNLGFASGLNSFMHGGDECVWYWINIMVDTTIGTAVAFILMKIANAFIRKKLSSEAAEDFKTGEYMMEDGHVNLNRYAKQLGVWLLVISCMKIIMVMFMFLLSGPLLGVANFVLAPFLTQPWLKLLVVMVVCPILMDGFQIWMMDNFLRKKQRTFMTAGPDGELEDLEESSPYVEAAAHALLAASARCEVATEEALQHLKAKCEEATHMQSHEFLSEKAEPTKSQQTAPNFDTQFVFQTRVPPDQAFN